MFKKILLINITFLLFACSGENDSINIPDNILSKEKMAKVMMDIHLLEASMNTNSYSPQKNAITGGISIINEDVFKNNQITKVQYDESFQFYTNHPQLLSEVYQLVLNDLSKMQAEVMNGN